MRPIERQPPRWPHQVWKNKQIPFSLMEMIQVEAKAGRSFCLLSILWHLWTVCVAHSNKYGIIHIFSSFTAFRVLVKFQSRSSDLIPKKATVKWLISGKMTHSLGVAAFCSRCFSKLTCSAFKCVPSYSFFFSLALSFRRQYHKCN